MRFILKSVFWLSVMFAIIGPAGATLDAGDLSDRALAAGRTLVTEQVRGAVLGRECADLLCEGGRAVLATALAPPTSASVIPMQDSPKVPPVPLPRPRPDRAG